MEYRNPDLPEGINSSEEHPLKEFGLLVFGILGTLVVVTLLLGYFAGNLAGYIPFWAEQRLAGNFASVKTHNPEMQSYLQDLANRLAKAEQLPPDMPVSVHYVDGDTVNAFATLGGHVVMFRGLLEKVPDENTLAMVMAHEIAHIKTRAPIRSLGRGVVFGAVLEIVDAELGTSLGSKALGQVGLLTQLSFSRTQESEADAIGQAALFHTYGGVAGADTLFHILDKVDHGKGKHFAEWYRSHPEIRQRLADLRLQAETRGWSQGKITPLPQSFTAWLKSDEKDSADQ